MYDALFIQQKHYDMCLRCVPFPVFVMSLLTHSTQHWYVCSWQVKKLAGEVIKRIVSSPPSCHQPSRRSKDVWKIKGEKYLKRCDALVQGLYMYSYNLYLRIRIIFVHDHDHLKKLYTWCMILVHSYIYITCHWWHFLMQFSFNLILFSHFSFCAQFRECVW